MTFPLSVQFNSVTGVVPGLEGSERRLSQLRGCFADERAFEEAARADPVVYAVTGVEIGNSPGDLHYGVGVLYPGRVGDEFYLTRGHVHAWREAAEVYVTTHGAGLMLLEDERSGRAWAEPMTAASVLVVPPFTLHRTVNVGDEPLVYVGVYPAAAGHDYAAVESRGFDQVALADASAVTCGIQGVRVTRRNQ